jgi:hypothetical protein
MADKENLEARLEELRQEYKAANENRRKVIVMQAKLIKWAIEKCEKSSYEQAKKIFR